MTHYLPLTAPYALALVTGQIDTIPLWDEPGEAMGKRVAIVATDWHAPTHMDLVQFHGVKIDRRDMVRTGRVGSVVVGGWVRRESLFSRKAISGAGWPKRPVPRQCGLVIWRVEQPKVEINQTTTGLTRLLVSYEDRPQTREAVREYGDRYGRSSLPSDSQRVYDELKGESHGRV